MRVREKGKREKEERELGGERVLKEDIESACVSEKGKRDRKKKERRERELDGERERIELIGKHAVGNISVDRSEQLTTTIEMK